MGADATTRASDDCRRRALLRRLANDAATVEAVSALRGAGIRAILLKGPAIARWLYDEPWERTYGDIDLLIAPADHVRAGQVLQGLGYTDTSLADPGIPAHASQWTRTRAPIAEIDLHCRIPLAAEGDDAWAVLSADTEPMTIGAAKVETLSPAARAMLIAVHAVQHGARSAKPMRDLQRALERADVATWRHAAALARQLGVQGPFAVALNLVPAGTTLAHELALPPSSSLEAHLRSVTPSATSVGWMHLLERRSLRSRLRLLRGELMPSPAFMRAWNPMARRGRAGLACAYLLRPLWLLRHLPPALRDLSRARRDASRYSGARRVG